MVHIAGEVQELRVKMQNMYRLLNREDYVIDKV